MMRTFAGKLGLLAALLGFVLVALLAGAGYTLVSTIRAANEAVSTYADELILAWSLQEAYERKLASGRGYVMVRDPALMHDFQTAAVDAEVSLGKLRQRVTSKEGVALLAEVTRTLAAHDDSLRAVMAVDGSVEASAAAWATGVMPKAWRARHAMDAFIRHKQALHDAERAHVARAQQEATWVVGSTALAAVLMALFGGGRLLRSA